MSKQTKQRGVVLSCLLALVAIVLLPTIAIRAQEPESKSSTAQRRTTNKPVVEAEKKPRMPAHFNKVVSPKQREKVLAILEEYLPQIEQKRAELKALVDQRDKAVFGVLTPEQQREVEELRAESRASRAATLAANRRKREQAEAKASESADAKP